MELFIIGKPMLYLNVFDVQEDGSVWRNGRQLKTEVTNVGYLRVNTRVGGKGTRFSIHRALAECFIPNPEGKPCVNHKDGVKANNRLENLEWVTHSENSRHSFRTGLQVALKGKDAPLSKLDQRGEKNHRCKLTDLQVTKIKEGFDMGMTQGTLAKDFGVSQSQVSRIVSGKRRHS